MKKASVCWPFDFGAEGGIRTPTGLLQLAPEASASAVPPLPQVVKFPLDGTDSIPNLPKSLSDPLREELRRSFDANRTNLVIAQPLRVRADGIGEQPQVVAKTFGYDLEMSARVRLPKHGSSKLAHLDIETPYAAIQPAHVQLQ